MPDLTITSSGEAPSYSRDDYTVGWLCALPIEHAAAQSMLDKVHISPRQGQDSDDTNTYKFGLIGHHNTVIASLGRYGTNNSATVVSHMSRSFPNLRAVLMVGIGGGVPGQVDIRLGDVVVGTEVVQYDLGKSIPQGRFVRQQSFQRPSQILRTALTALRGEHELRSSRIPSILASLEATDAARHCKHPGAEEDLLFDGYYDHKTDQATCKHCDRSRLVSRLERDSHEPKIHYGLIGSGNQLQKAEGQKRDEFAKELGGAICFEMEGAGLFDSLPCLNIRGISDYAETHKNKQWQGYASMAAAAYAKEFLSVFTPRHKEGHRESVLSSLKYTGINSRKAKIEKPYKQTCQWLVDLPQFAEWDDWGKSSEHHGFLWIQGKPGSGKSTMMKFLFQRAQSTSQQQNESKTTVLSFFFHARGQDIEKSTLGMYRSLLHQLFQAIPTLRQLLDDLEPQSDWSIQELSETLYLTISKIGAHRLVIFIDALDECHEDEVISMIDHLDGMWAATLGSKTELYVCLSTRHYPYIHISNGIRVVLEDQTGHRKDLESYVQNKLLIGPPSTIAEVTHEILQKASGIFLWVALVVDILSKEFRRGSLHSLRKRLKQIPPGLNNLFRDLLLRGSEVDPEDVDLFQLCIQLIVHGERPLDITEFYSAMVFAQDEIIVLGRGTVTDDDRRRYLLYVSKGLAQVNETRVEFIHESVREFFLQENELWSDFPQLRPHRTAFCHDRLKDICLRYIKAFLDENLERARSDLQHWGDKSTAMEMEARYLSDKHPIIGSKITQNHQEFQFLLYAGLFLFSHAEKAGADIHQEPFLNDLIRESDYWTQMNHFVILNLDSPAHRSLPYYLARKGYKHLVFLALDLMPQSKRNIWPHGSPLIAAIKGNHDELARAFVEKGMNVNEKTPIAGQTPLLAALEARNESLARYLIEQGANVQITNIHYSSVLRRAVTSGLSAGFVSFLIRHGANVNDYTGDRESLLRVAILRGNHRLLEVLLPSGIEVDERCLLLAMDEKYVCHLGLLLRYIADFDVYDSLFKSAIHKAMSRKLWRPAEVLLRRLPDLRLLDRDLENDLRRAAKYGCRNIVSLLLARGVNADRQAPYTSSNDKGKQVAAPTMALQLNSRRSSDNLHWSRRDFGKGLAPIDEIPRLDYSSSVVNRRQDRVSKKKPRSERIVIVDQP